MTGARKNELRQLQPLMEGLIGGLCKVCGKVKSHLCECHSESDVRTK